MAREQKLQRISKYGMEWGIGTDPAWIEIEMLLHGGRYRNKKTGEMVGNGEEFHFKELVKLLWPWIKWHKWAELQIDCWCKYRIIGQIGAASTGKSFISSACALTAYYVHPGSTTVLVSSTTRESLEMRVWGEIKKLHRSAKSIRDWLPGNLIEGKQRIVTDPRQEAADGRDLRNGLVGVACKRGQSFQGMEEYVGIKNKYLYMIADELQFLPRQFVDSISNMNKNRNFKCVGSGNPKETTDALGVLCEPAAHLGGWEGGVDQSPITKTWEIRFPQGICIQLPGSDSPNLRGDLGVPLITQENIDADIAFYGKDSIQYSMMDEGRMPRGQGNRRVITRNPCMKHGAMDDPIWLNALRTKIGCLDAAYRGVGGDRCPFMYLEFGLNSERSEIIALVETTIIPTIDGPEPAEDQIAMQVRERCERLGIPPENFGFDSTGRGSLMSAFARLWSPHVIAIEFGGHASDRPVSSGIDMNCREYYSKFVTELWYSVRLVVEAGQFRGMTEDVMAEGCAREWKIVAGNKIEVEPKDKTKLKTGRSPDLFDTLAAGIEVARRRGFNIKFTPNPLSGRNDGRWKSEMKERSRSLWSKHDLVHSN